MSSSIEVAQCENRLYEPVILLAKQYHQATGVSVRVFNSEVSEIYRVDYPSWGCQFCQHMRDELAHNNREEHHPREHCNRTHVFSAVRAKQLNRYYVYQCRSGFIFWSSPIVVNGRLVASVVAGSMILMDRSEFIKQTPNYHLGKTADAQGIRLLEAVQQSTATRVEALAEILYLSCNALSQKHSNMLLRGVPRANIHDIVFNPEFGLYEELLIVIEAGNQEEAKQLALEILEKIELMMAHDFQGIKEQVLDLAIFLTNATNIQGSGDFSLNVQFVKDLQNISTPEGLREWLLTVIEMVGSIPSRVGKLKYGHLLVQAVRYMHQNFAKNLTLEEVSRIAKLSPSYFSRLFKAEMGVSFVEYLNQIRINESKRKLQFTNLSLVDIASACGFSDQSYFTKIFKRTQGLSPGRYRQNQKG
ncbi:AraC family transcriptional regulator [Entomospira nematocerorum]|uniref:AraC family transcriptional regulator n=1 Tax=Entomospira nematocerorum TaxID=2719987 RepID=A0A968GCW8_9SPIO|nr:AraC family transcriptional regulator [Entomospira nematocera]NIZ47525.1 AraC family transcriptional regulator [Entomospira nematocera]WDI33935.1 AraC family transcriptional regulator [Entomospira nematocera]